MNTVYNQVNATVPQVFYKRGFKYFSQLLTTFFFFKYVVTSNHTLYCFKMPQTQLFIMPHFPLCYRKYLPTLWGRDWATPADWQLVLCQFSANRLCYASLALIVYVIFLFYTRILNTYEFSFNVILYIFTLTKVGRLLKFNSFASKQCRETQPASNLELGGSFFF